MRRVGGGTLWRQPTRRYTMPTGGRPADGATRVGGLLLPCLVPGARSATRLATAAKSSSSLLTSQPRRGGAALLGPTRTWGMTLPAAVTASMPRSSSRWRLSLLLERRQALSTEAMSGRRSKNAKRTRKEVWWKQNDRDFNKGAKPHTAQSIELAVRDQNIQLLERMCTQNADFVQRKDNVLMVAAMYRGRKLMETLLQRGEDPNYTNAVSCTALHYCCSHDFPRGVALLLSYDAKIEVHDENGLTPLHQATVANSIECAKLLVEYGAKLSSEDKDGDQPLHTAARMGSFDVAQYLLEKGADVNSKNLRGESPLHLAVSDGHDKMAALLLEKGASTGSRDHNGLTPVHRAAQNSEGSACISMLIEKGAEINDTLGVGISPLHFAVYTGNLDAMAKLINAGALIEQKTPEGFNALMIAAQEGHLGCLSYLLNSKAMLDNRNDEGLSALHLAIAGDHISCAAMLIKKGADVNIKDTNRLTPLHLAAQNEKDDPSAAKLLLENGADINASTPEDGITALHAAIDNQNAKIALFLLECGASPNQAESNGNTPLHLALIAELPEVVEDLCQRGADVNARDFEGKTPLDRARELEEHAEEVVNLLKQYGAK